jgi:hypothetical protein
MILGVRACIALSGITSRTRQTHRTTEPCPHQLPPGPAPDPLRHPAGCPPLDIVVPALGGNSRQSSGQLACSVTALTDTPSWQLAVLSSVPQHWRCAPTEWSPSLGKPVSSTAHAVGVSAPTSRVASRRGPAASPRARPRRSGAAPGRAPPQRAGRPSARSTCGGPPASTPQIALTTGTLILARQRLEDVIGERLRAPTDSSQLAWCDASHPASLRDRRRIHLQTIHHTQT